MRNPNFRVESRGPIRSLISTSPVESIHGVDDFLELLSIGTEHRADLFIVKESNFSAAFYDLKTGLAGEIFQKCSNYHIRLVITGSFESIQSERFRELMREANRGSQIRFAASEDEAFAWLREDGQRTRRLLSIKLLHSLIWAFFVSVIAYILYAGIAGHIDYRVWIAIGLIIFEGAVLLLNRGKCPLTPIAARYTENRDDNFDIFLPLWLAKYNKQIFTGIFFAGVLIVLYRLATR